MIGYDIFHGIARAMAKRKNKKPEQMVRMSFVLPKHDLLALQRIADDNRTTMSWAIRQAIELFIRQVEKRRAA
jgi:hypothetical protein